MKKLGIIYAPRLSASAAALASAVPLYRVGPEGFKSEAGKRRWKYGPRINWGSSNPFVVTYSDLPPPILNLAGCVGIALSKLKTLIMLKEAGIPALEATGDVQVAAQWVGQSTLLCRKDGLSGGAGITKLEPGAMIPGNLVNSDFFVKYWKKTHEYRVHVFKGVAIDIQQKRKRTDWDGNYDPMIRNFDNGWVFCHDNIKGTEQELQLLRSTAISAVESIGLDFGAVDILARFGTDGPLRKHVVCEINTAPGLEGTTLDKYVQAIRGYLNAV